MRLLAALFSLLFVIVCPLSASAELPEISAAVETQLYQGTTEEITAFIGKRQAQVDDLISLITADVRMAKVESDKVAFAAVLDLFQGLSLPVEKSAGRAGTLGYPGHAPSLFAFSPISHFDL